MSWVSKLVTVCALSDWVLVAAGTLLLLQLTLANRLSCAASNAAFDGRRLPGTASEVAESLLLKQACSSDHRFN